MRPPSFSSTARSPSRRAGTASSTRCSTPGHRVDRRRQPAARPGRRRRGRQRPRPHDRRPGRARRPLLRRRRDLNVAADAGEITGLVYVAAFAPEPGESCFALAGDVPRQHARRRAAADRRAATARPTCTSPATASTSSSARTCPAAAGGADGGHAAAGHAGGAARSRRASSPLWKELPSWFVIGEEDRNIPAQLQRFMAERAGAQRDDRDPGRVARRRRLAPAGDGAT